MAQAASPCQWTHGDAAHFAVLSDSFDKFLARRQVAPPRVVRQRTRTMAFAGVPLLQSRSGHFRRCSLPLDFGIRAAEPILATESSPAITVSSSGGSISSGSAMPVSPPQSPTSRKREKKEKKEKKEKTEKKKHHSPVKRDVEEPADLRKSPRPDTETPRDRVSNSGEAFAEFLAADLHSYIATLLAPPHNPSQQTFKGPYVASVLRSPLAIDNIEWTLLAYRNYATPIELAASIHAMCVKHCAGFFKVSRYPDGRSPPACPQ